MGGILEIVDDDLYHSIQLDAEEGDWEEIDTAIGRAIRAEGDRVSAASEEAMFASKKGYEPKKTDWWGALRASIPEDLLPKRLTLKAGDRIPDFHTGPGSFLVSEAVRDIIEDLDPDVHQFVKVDIVLPDGTPYPHQQFYFFRCRQALNAVDPESNPEVKESSLRPSNTTPVDLTPLRIYHRTTPLAVFADRLNGAGIWREMRSPNYHFLSDALISRLEEAECNGWTVRPRFEEI